MLIHNIHIILILKILCAFMNSVVHDLYEHYSSTHTNAIVSVILSLLPCPCCGASVALSLPPFHCHGDVSITPSPSWRCPCRPVTVTGCVSVTLSLSRGVSATSSLSPPSLLRGVSAIPATVTGCLCHPVTVTLSLSQCRFITVAVSLSLCRYHSGSATMFFSSFHNHLVKVERK